ncbi:MAG: hypothetical protein H8D67_17310 [Deltaproteobacteria bacterium]|nr:hypothetical protein [Deltaproteobacteria bacterium]MBL7075341.1 hypothetical protein [candidate division KSB1 bacterium]
MAEFYNKFYREEFYVLSDRLPNKLAKDQSLFLNTFDYRNRCVNFNAISPDKRRFEDGIFNDGFMEFCKKWSHFDHFKKQIREFYRKKGDSYISILDEFTSKGQANESEKINLHYHLVELYHSFPSNPEMYLDGILRKLSTQLAKRNIRFRYATIDLVEKEKCDFKDFPWVKMTFFDPNEPSGVIKIKIDSERESEPGIEEILASQETLDILENCPPPKETEPMNSRPTTNTDERFKPHILHNYLYPLFSKKKKDFIGGDWYIDEPPKSFLVMPIYSADFHDGDFGTIIGYFFLPFTSKQDRGKFLKNHKNELDKLWQTWTTLTLQTLLEGKKHLISDHDLRHDDSLKDFLDSIAFVQDWERVLVFGKEEATEPEYCFKRFKGGKDGKWLSYEEVWDICRNGKKGKCNGCIKGFGNKSVKDLFMSSGRDPSPKKIYKDSTNDKWFFFLYMDHILDPRVLPSIEEADKARYSNHIICFEFPEYTFFPTEIWENEEEAVEELGDHYVKKLLPSFDKVILKRRVLKHSIKSAVAAIMSRNMSHNIGSHILARIKLEEISWKVKDALKRVNDDRITDICNLLFEEFHQYIQKKSDFLAEISTEPYISPRSAFFYKDVILPLTEKILLLDYIARNDGIRYEQLSIRFFSKSRSRGCCCELAPVKYEGKECSENDNKPKKVPFHKVCLDCAAEEGYAVDDVRYYVNGVKNSNYDVMLDLPGSVGEFAIYNILEAIIRNSAKHNSSKIDNGTKLEISIKVEEDEDPALYICTVWDNLSDEDLINKMNGYIEETIVDQKTGKLRPQNWGIAEMKICAVLLQDRSFEEMESDPRRFLEAVQVSGNRLGYRFKILRARRSLLLLENTWDKLCNGG